MLVGDFWRMGRRHAALLLVGLSATLSLPGEAATPVSGPILVNTVWTAAAGPYEISGAIAIRGSAVLTIEAGTTLRFQPGASLTARHIPAPIGVFLAAGTTYLPVQDAARLGKILWRAQLPRGSGEIGLQFIQRLLQFRQGLCGIAVGFALRHRTHRRCQQAGRQSAEGCALE